MAKKEKLIPCIVASREAMESVVADIVRLKLQHAESKAKMEQEIADVQKKYQHQQLSIAKQIEIKEAGVYLFCQQHRKELFTDKKSLDLLLAVVGFRTHPPSVEKVRSKDTWGQIATRLASSTWGETYVKYPDPVVDKQSLITDRTKLTTDQLDTIGVRIDQEESFYIEPKSEVAEASVKEAA